MAADALGFREFALQASAQRELTAHGQTQLELRICHGVSGSQAARVGDADGCGAGDGALTALTLLRSLGTKVHPREHASSPAAAGHGTDLKRPDSCVVDL